MFNNFSKLFLPLWVMLMLKWNEDQCHFCYLLPFLVKLNGGALSRKRSDINNTSLSTLPKEEPSEVLLLDMTFFFHCHRISSDVFCPKSRGRKREMRSRYEFIFPCWILKRSITEFVSNLVGLIPGVSIMPQNTPTDLLMKRSSDESHTEASACLLLDSVGQGWSRTHTGGLPWS